MRDSWHAEISVLATVASTTSPLPGVLAAAMSRAGEAPHQFPLPGPETTSWVRGCPCTTRASNKGFNRAKKEIDTGFNAGSGARP